MIQPATAFGLLEMDGGFKSPAIPSLRPSTTASCGARPNSFWKRAASSANSGMASRAPVRPLAFGFGCPVLSC